MGNGFEVPEEYELQYWFKNGNFSSLNGNTFRYGAPKYANDVINIIHTNQFTNGKIEVLWFDEHDLPIIKTIDFVDPFKPKIEERNIFAESDTWIYHKPCREYDQLNGAWIQEQ